MSHAQLLVGPTSNTLLPSLAPFRYGFFRLALAILMVLLVHFVEAYLLNPAIYSHHLKV